MLCFHIFPQTDERLIGMLLGRYSKNPNKDLSLRVYSGKPYSSCRVNRGNGCLRDPLLTILLMVQPSILDGLVGGLSFREVGLPARFHYCLPRSRLDWRSLMLPW